MSLTVKAYVLPGRSKKNDFEEIRRFTITKTDVKDFKKLFQKVCEVFPTLEKDKTSLHWKDDDGDLIHFTTNSELAEAIKCATNGVFKLYAQEKPLFKDSTELHLGVVCSNCKLPVEGSRYKCLACHDYDLCHSCELVGTHLEHTMIKIPTPNTPWVAQIMQYSYTYGPMSPMSPMLLKCRTEDGGTRNAIPLSMDEQLSPMMDRPSFASAVGQPYSRNDWSLFNDTPLSSRSGIGQASAMEVSYHSDGMQSRQGRTTDPDSLDIVNQSTCRESLFNYNESPPDKTSGDWTIVNSTSKSKDINGITSTCTTSSAKYQTESTRVTEFSCVKETSSINVASASEMTSSSSRPGKDEHEKSLMGPDDVAADSTAIANEACDEDGTATDGTDNEAVTTTTTTAAQAPADDGDAVPNREETVSSTTKDSKEEKEETTKEESKEAKPIVDNNLYYPKVRRYAEALDNLMSMGFTNEGGWLTVLVEEKRGDIIRVLDFIENNIQKCRENEEAKSRN